MSETEPTPARVPATAYPYGPRTPGTPRPVVIVGTAVLHRPARPVTSFDQGLTSLIDDMFATMYVADGVGLAAPQIADDRSVFVFDCPDQAGERHVGHLVNPELVDTSEQTESADEGCLSVPGPYFELERPTTATVRGVDRSGAPVEVTGTGFFARCLLHETDHLAGMLYIDRLRGTKRRRALREMTPFDWNAPLPIR